MKNGNAKQQCKTAMQKDREKTNPKDAQPRFFLNVTVHCRPSAQDEPARQPAEYVLRHLPVPGAGRAGARPGCPEQGWRLGERQGELAQGVLGPMSSTSRWFSFPAAFLKAPRVGGDGWCGADPPTSLSGEWDRHGQIPFLKKDPS